MDQLGPSISSHGLIEHGIQGVASARWNLPVEALYEEALGRGEAVLARGGALVTRTGQHTGRAPNDKFIVDEAASRDQVWWGDVNRPITQSGFDALQARLLRYLEGRDVFVQDCFAGADPSYRLGIRIVTEAAWHSLFARNMFIRPAPEELSHFAPEFTVIHAPGFAAEPERDGTNSRSSSSST